MSKEATRQQLADILARERRRLGLDKSLTDEQVVYKKVEVIATEVVKEAKTILANTQESKVVYDREHLQSHMQKQLAHRFMQTFSKEEMGFLLSVIHAQELLANVETQ